MKCENCGASESVIKNTMVTCLFCGSKYYKSSKDRQNKAILSDSATASQETKNANEAGNEVKAKKYLFAFFLTFLFFFIIITVNKETDFIGYMMRSRYQDTEYKEYSNGLPKATDPEIGKNAIRTNPDSLVLLTNIKVYQSRFETRIAYVIDNKVNSHQRIISASITFKLFDKDGVVLGEFEKGFKDPDWGISSGNRRNFEISLPKNDKVKNVKLLLKTVKFDNFTWTYKN